MARYRGPANKLYRNYGVTDISSKKIVSAMKQYASGQHGQARKKVSDYAVHLNEKQKIRLTYLVSEKQFLKYYKKASKGKDITGTALLQILESRLDNVLYRSGFCTTRRQSRQLINHGHVLIDGQKVDIPSFLMKKQGQVISIRSKSTELFKTLVEYNDAPEAPAWLSVDRDALKVTFERLPQREEIDPEFKEHLVIEYYSK